MDLHELAQYTYQGLKKAGIRVTLSGGACVSIFSENAYQSNDLDFIREIFVDMNKLSSVMKDLGFKKEGRHFTHPDSAFYVEFPNPPLMVGEERPKLVREYLLKTVLGRQGVLMLSPTDCVKDRLCGFYHWNDKQSLDQALLVAKKRKVDVDELRRWSRHEGMIAKFRLFQKALILPKRKLKNPK